MLFFEKLLGWFHGASGNGESSDPHAPPVHLQPVPLEKVNLSLIDSVSELVLSSPVHADEGCQRVYHFWHKDALHARMITESGPQGLSTEYCMVALRRGPKQYDPVLYFRRYHAPHGFVIEAVRMQLGAWERTIEEAVCALRERVAARHRRFDPTILPAPPPTA